MAGALAGLKVVELGQLIAGPFCGQLMGDMGAEIVKIEPPGKGDPMRQWGLGDPPLWWEVIGRNKKSVTADLRQSEGQEIARRLIGQADILIENFRAGTLERWHLDPVDLMRANPGLIVVRISGYGQTGPYAKRAGFGGIGEALGGWRGIVGTPDRPPSRLGVSIGDSLAGSYGCIGALAALEDRHRTGKGQVVDTSLYESVLQVMESLVPEFDALEHIRERSGSILRGIAPSNVYPARDGELLIAANQDAIFRRLCTAMGRAELADDPRYASHSARGARQDELDAIISAWTSQHDMADIETLMEEHSVPAGRMFTARDMTADPHFEARETIVAVETERHGMLKMQNVFPKLSRTPGTIAVPARATPGADNADILRPLGYNDDDLAALKAQEII